MYTHCVLGGFPGLHFADVLHVLELSQLGQRVVAQRLVERRVAVLVLHVELGLSPHQQLCENNASVNSHANRRSDTNSSKRTVKQLEFNAFIQTPRC